MSGNSASLYFYCLYLLRFLYYLSACPLSILSFEKFWENVNIRGVLENIFWNTCRKLWSNVRNFENIFEIFLNYFVELFRIFSRNLQKTAKKCRKSKFWINSGKIMEKYRSQFINFAEVTKNIENFFFFQILVKFWRKMGNTLYKFSTF